MHITFIHLSCHKENHVHSYESVQIQQKVHSFMFTDTTKITTDHVYIGLYLASFLTRFWAWHDKQKGSKCTKRTKELCFQHCPEEPVDWRLVTCCFQHCPEVRVDWRPVTCTHHKTSALSRIRTAQQGTASTPRPTHHSSDHWQDCTAGAGDSVHSTPNTPPQWPFWAMQGTREDPTGRKLDEHVPTGHYHYSITLRHHSHFTSSVILQHRTKWSTKASPTKNTAVCLIVMQNVHWKCVPINGSTCKYTLTIIINKTFPLSRH